MDAPNRLVYAAVAPSHGLSGNTDGDIVHSDGPDKREYGRRYFAGLKPGLTIESYNNVAGAFELECLV